MFKNFHLVCTCQRIRSNVVSCTYAISKLILINTALTCSADGLRGQVRTSFHEVTSCCQVRRRR